MKVLIVDDDQMVRDFLVEAVQSVGGCEARSAASAEAALDIVASGADFDLLLTDMQMTGQSGAELVSRLRGLGYIQPMYVLTGLVTLKSVPGATGVLHKPLKLAALEAVIKTHSC